MRMQALPRSISRAQPLSLPPPGSCLNLYFRKLCVTNFDIPITKVTEGLKHLVAQALLSLGLPPQTNPVPLELWPDCRPPTPQDTSIRESLHLAPIFPFPFSLRALPFLPAEAALSHADRPVTGGLSPRPKGWRQSRWSRDPSLQPRGHLPHVESVPCPLFSPFALSLPCLHPPWLLSSPLCSVVRLVLGH